jgi:hypothetical protein
MCQYLILQCSQPLHGSFRLGHPCPVNYPDWYQLYTVLSAVGLSSINAWVVWTVNLFSCHCSTAIHAHCHWDLWPITHEQPPLASSCAFLLNTATQLFAHPAT